MRVYCGEQCDWVLLSALSAVFIADWKAVLISLSFDANGSRIFDGSHSIAVAPGNLMSDFIYLLKFQFIVTKKRRKYCVLAVKVNQITAILFH